MYSDWLRALAALTTGFVVGIANNLVNNLPLGLIAGATLQAEHARGLIANAVLIGVDLGPNLSVTGSLATILWLIALRKEKLVVSGWDFFKVGAIAMPVALVASLGGAILMQILLSIFAAVTMTVLSNRTVPDQRSLAEQLSSNWFGNGVLTHGLTPLATSLLAKQVNHAGAYKGSRQERQNQNGESQPAEPAVVIGHQRKIRNVRVTHGGQQQNHSP